MKVSIITICYNAADTIRRTIESIKAQSYSNIEYIIVDGNSKDGTKEIITANSSRVSFFLSEPDNGIYDAMNKGLRLASGDIVAFLNADDTYYDNNVIDRMVRNFNDYQVDCIYSNIMFVRRNKITQATRLYDSSIFRINRLKHGIMPAHPSMFVKRAVLLDLGGFSTKYKIASDFEFCIRLFLVKHATYKYVDEISVKMCDGGISSMGAKSKFIISTEIKESLLENGMRLSNFGIVTRFYLKIIGHIRLMVKILLHPQPI